MGAIAIVIGGVVAVCAAVIAWAVHLGHEVERGRIERDAASSERARRAAEAHRRYAEEVAAIDRTQAQERAALIGRMRSTDSAPITQDEIATRLARYKIDEDEGS